MTLNEIAAAALQLDARSRARLVEQLLSSLEATSEEEIARLWVLEAERRDAEMDAHPDAGRPADDMIRAARKLI